MNNHDSIYRTHAVITEKSEDDSKYSNTDRGNKSMRRMNNFLKRQRNLSH